MLSKLDKSLIFFDSILRNLHTSKPNIVTPAAKIHNQEPLAPQELQQSIAMMRINHSGEVCAQALYQGQALVAKSRIHFLALLDAAAEETNHLFWCRQRLKELNAQPSLLNPFWYTASFAIGACAGIAGDKISMGFVAETEQQVGAHLALHLQKISPTDQKSRAILEQMRNDELEHAYNAQQAGGVELPIVVKFLMRCTAKVLTFTAARI